MQDPNIPLDAGCVNFLSFSPSSRFASSVHRRFLSSPSTLGVLCLARSTLRLLCTVSANSGACDGHCAASECREHIAVLKAHPSGSSRVSPASLAHCPISPYSIALSLSIHLRCRVRESKLEVDSFVPRCWTGPGGPPITIMRMCDIHLVNVGCFAYLGCACVFFFVV